VEIVRTHLTEDPGSVVFELEIVFC
jgi:hypothetical protein